MALFQKHGFLDLLSKENLGNIASYLSLSQLLQKILPVLTEVDQLGKLRYNPNEIRRLSHSKKSACAMETLCPRHAAPLL
jgi:hypothetical protein